MTLYEIFNSAVMFEKNLVKGMVKIKGKTFYDNIKQFFMIFHMKKCCSIENHHVSIQRKKYKRQLMPQ